MPAKTPAKKYKKYGIIRTCPHGSVLVRRESGKLEWWDPADLKDAKRKDKKNEKPEEPEKDEEKGGEKKPERKPFFSW